MTGPTEELYRPAGSLAEGAWSVVLTPEAAGWEYCGLRAAALAPGATIAFGSAGDEVAVLPLEGAFEVAVDGTRYELDGRPDVWAGPTDFLYAPPGSSVEVGSAGGGRFAVATARGERRFPVRYVAASDVAVEMRGAGASSREVRNFAAAHRFEADRLIAVEVLSPGGNWGSYPPHKHDEVRPGETELEEIYHYVVARRPGRTRAGVPARLWHSGAAARAAHDGRDRRCRPRPARLARPRDGGAGLRPVLPQRDGRTR